MNKRNWFKKSNEQNTSSYLYKVLRILIYCFDIFCALLFAFYIVGNYQNFEDRSQKIILNALSYASIFTCLLTIPVIVDSVFILIGKGSVKKTIKTLVGMILTIVFCILLISISSLLTFLSAGI